MSVHSESQLALLDVVHGVRRRWRTRRAMNGIAIALAIIAVMILIASNVLGRGTPDAATLMTGRIILGVSALAALAWFALRPLFRQVSDERVALYIEEHEPSLKATLLGAVDMAGTDPRGEISPALMERLVRTAVEKCKDIDFGKRIERPRLMKSSGFLTAAGLACVVLFLMAPTTVRHGASRLLLPLSEATATPAFSIDVTPGTDTVARGADVTLKATLKGFVSEKAELLVKIGAATEYLRYPMAGDGKGAFEFVLFDLANEAEYVIESEGV